MPRSPISLRHLLQQHVEIGRGALAEIVAMPLQEFLRGAASLVAQHA